MIWFIKISLPIIVLGALFDKAYDQASAILDVVAVATVAGSVFAYSRIKAALVVSESAGKSWHEEADAQKERADRNAKELKDAEFERTKLIAEIAALNQRPDLTRLEGLVAESTESMKNHEIKAGERTERLITAVEKIADGQRAAALDLAERKPAA